MNEINGSRTNPFQTGASGAGSTAGSSHTQTTQIATSPFASREIGQSNTAAGTVDTSTAASDRTPTKTPVQLSHDQILAATFACLHEEGYDKTTIRRIAKRLGCAIGSIYRYFRDKRELLYVVTQQLLEPVVTLIDLEEPVSVERAETIYARAAATDPEAYRLMFWLACHTEPNDPARMPAVVRKIIAHWAKQLGSEEAALTRWSLLHGKIILGQVATEPAHASSGENADAHVEDATEKPVPNIVINPVQVPDPSVLQKGNDDDVVML